MKSGATESSYFYLEEHYKIPDNVFVHHLPEEIKKSNHEYKILWAQHAYDQQFFLNFDHHILHHIVSPSQWNKEQFMKYHNVPEHKITVIPTGIAEMFTYSNQKTKTMIFTSIPYKGLEVLARIIPMIHQVHPDTKFKIFSSMSLYGPSNDPYLQLYDHLKTMKNVEYSPAVDREELVKHYQESAFFIHPNIWEETFCVAMTEAMKCGAYPIITNIGALAEVAGEKNATVVPIEGENTSKGWKVTDNFLINFVNACCMALEYYDKEQKYYHEVSKLISDYVSERYNWKRVSEMWKNTIETLTGSTTHSVSFRPQTMDDWIFNEVYVENSYEVDTFNEHDVVIDIGGHAGYFSKLCMDKGCKNVFAYEAEPNNYSLMRSNLSNYKHFAAYNLAVWKTSNEYLEFYTLPNKPNTGLNSFYKTHFEEGQFVPIQVETISLDDILFKFQKVKLLKLDVEGSEYEILMNSKLLHKVEKIVGEYHIGMTSYNEEMLFKYLKFNGFKIEKVTQNSGSEEQGLSSGTFFAINQNRNKGFGV